MNRAEGRALAKSTLEGLELFDLVESFEPEVFTGARIAIIHSKGLGYVEDARDSFTSPAEIWVTIYVKRASGDSAGATVEDLLDDLVRRAVRALATAFSPYTEQLQITSQSGFPPKNLKGQNYRMERFAVQFNDDDEE
jgi:hypothetical protein